MSEHYLMFGLSSTLSTNGVNFSHAVYSSTDATSISSVVTQLTRVSLTWIGENTPGRLATVRVFSLSGPSCSVVSSSLSKQTT